MRRRGFGALAVVFAAALVVVASGGAAARSHGLLRASVLHYTNSIRAAIAQPRWVARPAAKGSPAYATAAPTVGGTPQEGQTLTASTGSWGGTTPISYGYQWLRCSTGELARTAAFCP